MAKRTSNKGNGKISEAQLEAALGPSMYTQGPSDEDLLELETSNPYLDDDISLTPRTRTAPSSPLGSRRYSERGTKPPIGKITPLTPEESGFSQEDLDWYREAAARLPGDEGFQAYKVLEAQRMNRGQMPPKPTSRIVGMERTMQGRGGAGATMPRGERGPTTDPQTGETLLPPNPFQRFEPADTAAKIQRGYASLLLSAGGLCTHPRCTAMRMRGTELMGRAATEGRRIGTGAIPGNKPIPSERVEDRSKSGKLLGIDYRPADTKAGSAFKKLSHELSESKKPTSREILSHQAMIDQGLVSPNTPMPRRQEGIMADFALDHQHDETTHPEAYMADLQHFMEHGLPWEVGYGEDY